MKRGLRETRGNCSGSPFSPESPFGPWSDGGAARRCRQARLHVVEHGSHLRDVGAEGRIALRRDGDGLAALHFAFVHGDGDVAGVRQDSRCAERLPLVSVVDLCSAANRMRWWMAMRDMMVMRGPEWRMESKSAGRGSVKEQATPGARTPGRGRRAATWSPKQGGTARRRGHSGGPQEVPGPQASCRSPSPRAWPGRASASFQ